MHGRKFFPPSHDLVDKPLKSRFSSCAVNAHFFSYLIPSLYRPTQIQTIFLPAAGFQSPAKGSPSRSTNRSPATGSASLQKPVPPPQAVARALAFRPSSSTCTRACSRILIPFSRSAFWLLRQRNRHSPSFAIVRVSHASNCPRCWVRMRPLEKDGRRSAASYHSRETSDTRRNGNRALDRFPRPVVIAVLLEPRSYISVVRRYSASR